MSIWMESTAKFASFCELFAREILIEKRGPIDCYIEAIFIIRFLVAHVMISQAHAVGDFPIQD